MPPVWVLSLLFSAACNGGATDTQGKAYGRELAEIGFLCTGRLQGDVRCERCSGAFLRVVTREDLHVLFLRRKLSNDGYQALSYNIRVTRVV